MRHHFHVGFEKAIPDWFCELENNAKLIIHRSSDRFINRVHVNTTMNGTQIAYMGDYIVVTEEGLLEVKRPSVLLVTKEHMCINSDT